MGRLFEFVTEDLAPEDDAKALTQPIWSDLVEVWRSAQQDWDSLSEEHRARLLRTAFVPPIVVFGFAQSYAADTFSNREGDGIVQCDALGGVFGFYIHEKVLLRFNVLDRHYLVRHSPNGSKKKTQYLRHEPIPGILNSATRLTAGYVANATKTGISSIRISCQVGEDLVYSFPIDGEADGPLSLPAPSEGPSPVGPDNTQLKKARPR